MLEHGISIYSLNSKIQNIAICTAAFPQHISVVHKQIDLDLIINKDLNWGGSRYQVRKKHTKMFDPKIICQDAEENPQRMFRSIQYLSM